MSIKTGLPGSAQPWGRDVEKRLSRVERATGLNTLALDNLGGQADKTVFSEFTTGQQIDNGVNGRVEFGTPVQVQYVSSTGLFEVTVGLQALSAAGANLGVSFEANEYPQDVYFDLPRYGVAASSANADVRYAPFSSSRSTVFSNRPGVYKFNLYIWANTTATVSSLAFINQAYLSVKAV